MSLSKGILDELMAYCKVPQNVEKLYSRMLRHTCSTSASSASFSRCIGDGRAAMGHPRSAPRRPHSRAGRSAG